MNQRDLSLVRQFYFWLQCQILDGGVGKSAATTTELSTIRMKVDFPLT